jgi:hypothetical protein
MWPLCVGHRSGNIVAQQQQFITDPVASTVKAVSLSRMWVSTNSFGNDYGSGTGGQYTLSGTPTGKSWPTTPPLTGEVYNAFYDGTSDGTHNYTVENGNRGHGPANVIATDLNWQNPVGLFSLGLAPIFEKCS